MAVAFRSLSQSDSFNAAMTQTAPAGIVDGDILLAFVMNDGTVMTLTPPVGWLPLGGPILSGASATLWAYWKNAQSEPGSWTWASSTGANWTIETAAYSGAAGVAKAINAVSTGVTAASTNTPTFPSVTPTEYAALVATFGTNRLGTAFPATPDAAATERAEVTSTNLSTLVGYLQDAAVATPAPTALGATFGNNGLSGWASISVAIAPPSNAGVVPDYSGFPKPAPLLR